MTAAAPPAMAMPALDLDHIRRGRGIYGFVSKPPGRADACVANAIGKVTNIPSNNLFILVFLSLI
jgi:hypothetical protein